MKKKLYFLALVNVALILCLLFGCSNKRIQNATVKAHSEQSEKIF
jgi:hypothetical protein